MEREKGRLQAGWKPGSPGSCTVQAGCPSCRDLGALAGHSDPKMCQKVYFPSLVVEGGVRTLQFLLSRLFVVSCL